MPPLAVRFRVTRHAARVASLPLTFAACASFGHPAGGAPPSNSTLYARLGGFEAIAAVADDFLSRVMNDSRLSPFFNGLEAKDMQRTRQHLVDLLCTATVGRATIPDVT